MCSSVPRVGGGPLSRSASARLNALSQRERERERALSEAGEGRGSVSRVVVARSTDAPHRLQTAVVHWDRRDGRLHASGVIDCGLGEGVGVGGREITSRAGQPPVPRGAGGCSRGARSSGLGSSTPEDRTVPRSIAPDVRMACRHRTRCAPFTPSRVRAARAHPARSMR